MKLILLTIWYLCCFSVWAKSYHRKDWKHWIDEDRDCLNTRHEILAERSLIPVALDKKGCRVLQGKWLDYYYAEEIRNSKQIDIDHLIPLKHAHESGGENWSTKEKQHFANDPENLVITNRKYNRAKGAKTISEWLPINLEFACRYYQDWMKLKHKYQLTISPEELTAVDIKKCSGITGKNTGKK